MLAKLAFVVVYGVSFGMVLFAISVGLAVTMGVMRVINLAHGAFAATGTYLALGLMMHWAVPLPLAIIAATAATVVISIPIERLLYRPIYDRSELDQVVLTIGIVFISIAALTAVYGPDPLPVRLPGWMMGNVDAGLIKVQTYRLFVIAMGAVIIASLYWLLNFTGFGVKLRAAVDNRGMAAAVGINVSGVFSTAFAIGAGLAALGGAIGYGLIPAEPTYAFKYIVIIFFVVGLAGEARIMSCALVAIGIGLVDTAARTFVPAIGSYAVYILAVTLMFQRSRGVFHAS
jgi:branched-chain amino acid transport system permease protein